MLRFLTAGESHGSAEIAILEGMPAGLALSHDDINRELKKRMHDFGRGGRGKIEADKVKILSGVRFGKTLGSPITLFVENLDFANWQGKMRAEDIPSFDKEGIKLTQPRPGHADLNGILKYGFDDVRNVLERASARETVMRVAVGAVCKKLLSQFGIGIASHTVQIGKVRINQKDYIFADLFDLYEKDPDTHCVDKNAREAMKQEINKARIEKNTLGGIVEIVAHNIPVGLGSYVHYDRKIDAAIAQALMSIPSVKAVEIGNGIDVASKTGKETLDAIFTTDYALMRKTNNMGGVDGGVTNGSDIVCRVYHKPLSTVYDPMPTVDIQTKKQTAAFIERSDVSVVARAGIVSESMLAFVLCQSFLEKFGADSMIELKRNYEGYLAGLPMRFEQHE